MSDPVIRRVRRSVEESTNSGGMLVGMPKVTIDAGDASRLCLLAEKLLMQDSELTRLQSEVERLRGRCGDIEDFCADKIGRLPLPHDRTDFANGRYTAFHEVYVEAQHLRQQPDEDGER